MSKQGKKRRRILGAPPRQPKRKPPVAMGGIDDAPVLAAEDDVVLGTLSSATESAFEPAPPRKSRKKQATDAPSDKGEEKEAKTPARADADTAPEQEPLRLPRGGFLAFRKSGGLHFSTREVVVYPDGKVAYDARGVPQKEYNRLRRALNDGQIGALRHMLDQTGFWKEEGGGAQNPDAFAYEITARLGQRSNEVVLFEGSVPERLHPLIEQLNKLLPE